MARTRYPMRRRWRHAATISVVVMLAACGGDDDDADSSGDASDSPTTTAPPATDPPTTDPPATTAPDTTPPATTAPATTAPPTTAPPTTAPPTTAAPAVPPLEFTIEGVVDGEPVPAELTCDQGNVPPVVNVTAVPEGTVELAMIVDDPDAPGVQAFAHWVVYGMPGDTKQFTDQVEGQVSGLNDFVTIGWVGPCPPPGDEPHRYFFTLYALSAPSELEPERTARQAFTAISPLILDEAEIMATHGR